jgi:hypothetical protein
MYPQYKVETLLTRSFEVRYLKLKKKKGVMKRPQKTKTEFQGIVTKGGSKEPS